MESRPLRLSDLPALRELASLAEAEGYNFVARFLAELTASTAPADALVNFFGLTDRNQLVAFGGVTPDPYRIPGDIGRLRHVYVRPDRRGEGIGGHLVALLENHARGAGYRLLRLRTPTVAAAHFYEQLGYEAVLDDTATHQRVLRVEFPTSS